jgi:hypothetical protein
LAESAIKTRFSGHFGFYGVITGFDGLSSVVLVRFHLNSPEGAWDFFLQEKPDFWTGYVRKPRLEHALTVQGSQGLGHSSLEPARSKIGFLTSSVQNYRFCLITQEGKFHLNTLQAKLDCGT